jgi:hypothetical protein
MSVGPDTLERIKNQLKEAQNTGHGVQQDLYSHLTEVFNKVIMNNPADAYDKFEEISALVKQTHLKFKDPQMDSEVNTTHTKPPASSAAIHVNKTRDLLSGTTQGVTSSMLSKKAFTLPNFAEEAEMLEWANIGFGEEETYKL